MNERRDELVSLLAAECVSVDDVQNLLKDIFKGTLETILETEMDEHHCSNIYSACSSNSGNDKMKLHNQSGKNSLNVPRGSKGRFESQHQIITENFEDRIITMYAKGISIKDIEEYLRDIYGVDTPAGLIDRITDKIMPDIIEWQNRPLASVYPIIYIDGIVFKVGIDSRVINKFVYIVMGISTEGRKEILGIWITENENPSFWTSVCSNLNNRGVRDILIACRNNLSGFSNAIKTVFPKTEQQLCIVNQVSKLQKHVLHEDLETMIADTKHIYSASSLDKAGYMLEEFRRRWYIQYPQIVKFWDDNWIELTTYFKYPEEVRRMIYTMNTIEGFHRIIRKFNKINTVYPTDDAVIKSVFLSIREINGKWSIPIKDWKIIIVQLTILFRGRIAA